MLIVSTRYYSWMGSSSVRRDILSQFREEQLALGTTGRRGRGRRGRRSGKDLTATHDPKASPTDSERFPHTTNGGSDKEITYTKHGDHEIDEEEEFFDAEDTNVEKLD
jgi:hypothetical protein